MRWTAAQIGDQTGMTAVVTGANSGIGLVTAGELARRGAEVVLACRDVGKGERAADRIRGAAPDARLSVRALDLADLGSVRGFAEEIGELDLLVNNAGVMATPYRKTADGFEMQLGTNHLGHFALTGLLLPALLARPRPRVVTVSSGMHRGGRIDFDDLNGERRYRKWGAYSQSKLANLLFAFELQRRAAGTALRSVAAHPGLASTNLQSSESRMTHNRLTDAGWALVARLIAQSADQGALPILYAATEPDLPGGSYVGPGGFVEMRGYPVLVASSAAARDQATARRLWELSEELTGVRYLDDGQAG
ncbi:oxidoreductase [Rhizohabitans arisaemae]|uniref:oxidoreductase n=1 Tax=Rhizohabitans arisaemae TaxID=2720610 RepID=UPI0024B20065|nr:oxidoreductase [Rhizohabitans arisaemae]